MEGTQSPNHRKKSQRMKKSLSPEEQKRANGARKARYIQKSAENKLRKTLAEPERKEQEAAFTAAHWRDSDHQLREYVKAQKRRRGKQMKPVNTIGYVYLTRRLGPWSEIMGRVNWELRLERDTERAGRAAMETAEKRGEVFGGGTA